MIERNLGNIERVVRLFSGLLLAAWALSQPVLNGIEWFVMIISIALILNGIFSRCYLWFVLDLNTYDSDKQGRLSSTSC
jgi:Inner membrane protein YgaP-like, transmembrane domain